MSEWTPEAIVKLAAAVPPYLWVGLAGVVFWRLREPIASNLARATNVEAFGVKLALAGESVRLAIELAAKNPLWTVTVPPEDRDAVLARAERERAVLQDAEILWIDDAPANNRNESRMLTALGAHVAFAASTHEALAVFRTAGQPPEYPIDLVISDMRRGEEADAGLKMLAEFAQAGIDAPVIFYVGQSDPARPVPAGAFGLTERPDRLLHYVLDALARRPPRSETHKRS